MSQPPSILVVGGTGPGRSARCRAVSAAGFAVQDAATGDEALQLAGVKRPDVVLLDANMPDVPGAKLCGRFRETPETARIPIVQISATATDASDQVRGLEGGADAYLVEPLAPEVLVATIRACLRARAAEQENESLRGELGRRVAELTRLHEMTRRLGSIADMPGILREVLTAVTHIQNSSMGNLLLFDTKSGRLEAAATVGISPEHAKLLTGVEPGIGSCGICFAAKQPVVVQNVETDPVYAPYREVARAIGYRSVHSIPLITLRGSAVGSIATFFREPHAPSQRETELVELYACQAAQAVENARLYAESAEKGRILDALMEHVPEGLVILDDAGRIRMVSRNALDMAGLAGAALSGQQYKGVMAPFRIFSPEQPGQPMAPSNFPSERAMCTGKATRDEELILERPDGTRLPVLANAAPLRDARGRIEGCVIAFRDITQRKAFERRLQEACKLESVGLLAGGVAHDFNNILTSVLGGASLALDLLPENHRAAPILQDVVGSAERAAHLTAQLLAYSGKGRFVIGNLDLSGVVREMLGLLRNSVPAGADLQFDPGAAVPAIQADIGQLRQLILSLAMNAAEALEDGRGTVLLKTGVREIGPETDPDRVGELSPGTYAYLEVRDTGCGMNAAVRARMFEPFFTTKFVGRGLSLAAALGIARGHGGGFEVQTVPGRGSTVRVLLPAIRAGGPGGQTILVVDDEEVVVRVVDAALRRGGFKPLVARTGDEAIRLFEAGATAIAAVILDLRLPGMSGTEVLAKVREISPHAKVILSTACDEAEAVGMVHNLGFSAFLRKPYTAAALLRKVEALLCDGPAAGAV